MKNETKNNKVKDLLDDLHKSVDDFFNSDKWANYLKFSSKFITRSANNQLLIWFFGGEDTALVMGYKQFITKLNRLVVACVVCRAIANKNCSCDERTAPVRIPQLAPMTYKKTNEKGEEEEKLFFRVVYVFKYSDTEQIDDKPYIEPSSIVEKIDVDFEDTEDYIEAFTKIIEDNKFELSFRNLEEDLGGYCSFSTNEIVINKKNSRTHQLKTMIHEIGHMFAHSPEELGNERRPRKLAEVEAESIAYVVANYIGLDSSDYSIGYVTSWSQNEEFVLAKSVNTVNKIATKITKLLTD